MRFRHALLQVNARHYAVCAMRNFIFDRTVRSWCLPLSRCRAPAAIGAVPAVPSPTAVVTMTRWWCEPLPVLTSRNWEV